MERRSFLKILATASTVAGCPALLSISEAEPSPNQKLIGMMREWMVYDISNPTHRPSFIVRFDIRASNLQLGMDARIPESRNESQFYRQSDLDHARQTAIEVLSAELDKRGISVNDLVPLPPPPEWMPNVIPH